MPGVVPASVLVELGSHYSEVYAGFLPVSTDESAFVVLQYPHAPVLCEVLDGEAVDIGCAVEPALDVSIEVPDDYHLFVELSGFS